MKKEQLFDAIDKIDDKYVSEAENYDPETMKIRVFPMISFVPATLVAASVAAVVLVGYFKVHNNDPLGPEIDNNIVTSITTNASDQPATDGTGEKTERPEDGTAYVSDEAVSGITGSYFTEVQLPVTDGSPKISASPDAGRVSSSPDSHTNSPSPSPTRTPSQTQTTSKITSPVPTGHPVTAAYTTQKRPDVTTEAPLSTEKYTETAMEVTRPHVVESPYPSPVPTTAPTVSYSPAGPALSPSPSPSPAGPIPSPAGPIPSPSPSPQPTNGAMPTGSPSSGVQSKLSCDGYSEAIEHILNDSAFAALRSESYIYYPLPISSDMPVDDPVQWHDEVTLMSSSDDKDAGIVKSASVNGNRFDVTVYTGDDYFITYSSDMEEYLRKRSGIRVSDTGDGKYFTDSDSGDVYFFIDEDHYCKVSSDADPDAVLKFAGSLMFGKYDLY